MTEGGTEDSEVMERSRRDNRRIYVERDEASEEEEQPNERYHLDVYQDKRPQIESQYEESE